MKGLASGFWCSRIVVGLFGIAWFWVAASARASFGPDCLAWDSKRENLIPLQVDNQRVVRAKKTTPNQTLLRARISGHFLETYRDRSNQEHDHFAIDLLEDGAPEAGARPMGERLEVVYNVAFGRLPPLKRGDQVEACGDYITSNAPTERYAPSPDGAIIHWVHTNPKFDAAKKNHESGFLKINGVVYGLSDPSPRPRPRSFEFFFTDPGVGPVDPAGAFFSPIR